MADVNPIRDEESRPFPDAGTIRRIAGRLGEGGRAIEARLAALEVYRAMPMLDRARHLWRYTRPEAVLPGSLEDAAPLAAVDAVAIPGEPPVTVTLLPGRPPQIRVTAAGEAVGITAGPLAADAPGLGSAVPARHGLLEALNMAAFDAGVLVRVPERTVLDGPVWIRLASGPGTFVPRILVEVGEGAVVTVVEEHAGGGDGHRVAVTEILAAPGSRVEHVPIQRLDLTGRGHWTVRAVAGPGASVTTAFVSLGGRVVKADLGTRLEGEGASSEILGFLLAGGEQRLDHHTVHRHEAPRTRSNIDFRTVLTDSARSAYTGLIRIEVPARGTEAYQENRNLLLSEKARADTIPELEILNEDVQCTHGATVSPVDPDQEFYLESRGLDPATAERLIVRGFLEPTLGHVPAGVRTLVEPVIAGRLERLGGGGR